MPASTSGPPLRLVTDDRLVALVRAGDEAAFTELHDRHRPGLERLAAHLLAGVAHDPEDVVQDAFLSAYRALRAIDRPVVLRPWLYAIVRNRALDHLRSPRARCAAPGGERALTLVPAVTGDPERTACDCEELGAMVAAIGRLPARQRLALVRRELEGRAVAEVACELGASLAATKMLVWRARQDLRAGCAPRSAAGR